jgi:hypothetical protein
MPTILWDHLIDLVVIQGEFNVNGLSRFITQPHKHANGLHTSSHKINPMRGEDQNQYDYHDDFLIIIFIIKILMHSIMVLY